MDANQKLFAMRKDGKEEGVRRVPTKMSLASAESVSARRVSRDGLLRRGSHRHPACPRLAPPALFVVHLVGNDADDASGCPRSDNAHDSQESSSSSSPFFLCRCRIDDDAVESPTRAGLTRRTLSSFC